MGKSYKIVAVGTVTHEYTLTEEEFLEAYGKPDAPDIEDTVKEDLEENPDVFSEEDVTDVKVEISEIEEEEEEEEEDDED